MKHSNSRNSLIESFDSNDATNNSDAAADAFILQRMRNSFNGNDWVVAARSAASCTNMCAMDTTIANNNTTDEQIDDFFDNDPVAHRSEGQILSNNGETADFNRGANDNNNTARNQKVQDANSFPVSAVDQNYSDNNHNHNTTAKIPKVQVSADQDYSKQEEGSRLTNNDNVVAAAIPLQKRTTTWDDLYAQKPDGPDLALAENCVVLPNSNPVNDSNCIDSFDENNNDSGDITTKHDTKRKRKVLIAFGIIAIVAIAVSIGIFLQQEMANNKANNDNTGDADSVTWGNFDDKVPTKSPTFSYLPTYGPSALTEKPQPSTQSPNNNDEDSIEPTAAKPPEETQSRDEQDPPSPSSNSINDVTVLVDEDEGGSVVLANEDSSASTSLSSSLSTSSPAIAVVVVTSTSNPTQPSVSATTNKPTNRITASTATSNPTRRITTSPSKNPSSQPDNPPPTKLPTNQPTTSKPTSGIDAAATGKVEGTEVLSFRDAFSPSTSQSTLNIQMKMDQFGYETSWTLHSVDLDTNEDVALLESVDEYTYEESEQISLNIDLKPGKYRFTLLDAFGDGFCCSNGSDGWYRMYLDGREVVRGAYYRFSVSHDILVGYNPDLTMNARDKDWLLAHNVRRKDWHERYGKTYVPLMWSTELAQGAQSWADELLNDCEIDGIAHESDVEEGENLAKNRASANSLFGQLYPPDYILKRWVEDEEFWGYPANAHLTQALWRSSRYLGCGDSFKSYANGDVCRVQVCRYIRAGNCAMGSFQAKIGDNWAAPMLEAASQCGPACPGVGCY